MTEALRVGLAGLGTVGGGVIRLLDANRELIARRAGRAIEVVAVSARDRYKDRGVDLTRFAWVDDTTALAQQADVRISGVPVGKVAKLELGPGDTTDATIQLDERYAPIPRDARAILRQKTLLGETYVVDLDRRTRESVSARLKRSH